MNYCPFCGEKIEESFKHCPFCGADLATKQVGDEELHEPDNEVKEDELIYILTNSDSPVPTALKPVPIQKDIYSSIEKACHGIEPELTGDLFTDEIIRAIPDLLVLFKKTIYDLDYDDYDARDDCRKKIYDKITKQMEEDKRNYSSFEKARKRMLKSNLVQPNFTAMNVLKETAPGGGKIRTEYIRLGERIDSEFVGIVRYIRAIAIREACKEITDVGLKLKAACYWYTFFSSTFGMKEYDAAEAFGQNSTAFIVTNKAAIVIGCIRRNDSLCEVSKELFRSAIEHKESSDDYEIDEATANKLITESWNNIAVYTTSKLGDSVPKDSIIGAFGAIITNFV